MDAFQNTMPCAVFWSNTPFPGRQFSILIRLIHFISFFIKIQKWDGNGQAQITGFGKTGDEGV
jgi:hypothetical protein